MLQGKEAHTTNLASKTAARYTNSALATNSNANPTHFSTGHSTLSVTLAASGSRVPVRRIVSYKAASASAPDVGKGRRERRPDQNERMKKVKARPYLRP